MAATAPFTVSVSGKQYTWDTAQLKKSLFDVASCERKTHRICRNLSLAERHVAGRSKKPYTARESTRVQQVLNQLAPMVLDSGDKELVALFHRAVCNHDRIHPKHQVTPVPIYRKHYRGPEFQIPKIHLTLDVRDEKTVVTTDLQVKRASGATALVLDGKDHTSVLSVRINGKRLQRSDYRYNGNELIILNAPKDPNFRVRVKSLIAPHKNTSLSGLYPSNGWLVTQCESQGARRIFFTIDRPAVLSEVTTTIIADKAKYPFRLSNGNQVGDEVTDGGTGRTSITWHDPFPKPSYLFATVLGDFGVVKDEYVTMSGRKVSLEIYVEHGKEDRVQLAMWFLKRAMEFDEKFFGLEYDLDSLKVVGVPDFAAGAMENKGLLIFNDIRLLVNSRCGTDANVKDVARVVGHEYFHNYSGNRVTVRSWDELALKEAFTDFRAMLFAEWLFGGENLRPEQVSVIWDDVVHMSNSRISHPLMVESFISPGEIYDGITYRGGREVFRALANVSDAHSEGASRAAFTDYFKTNDGKAATFEDLLSSVRKVLGIDMSCFERWFHQAGTPTVRMERQYFPAKKTLILTVRQDCPSPLDGSKQMPFHIPLPIEILGQDGKVLVERMDHSLTSRAMAYTFTGMQEMPIPVMLHGFSAPVLMQFDYSDTELCTIIAHCSDPFNAWAAARSLAKAQIKGIMDNMDGDAPIVRDTRVLDQMRKILRDPKISPQVKAYLLQLPGPRAITEDDAVDDLQKAAAARSLYRDLLAAALEKDLVSLLEMYPRCPFDPRSDDREQQLQVRELRSHCFGLLAHSPGGRYLEGTLDLALQKEDFNERIHAIRILASIPGDERKIAFAEFEADWAHDPAVYNHWISAFIRQAGASVKTVKQAMTSKGFLASNANHIRMALLGFARSAAFHDRKGVGYKFFTDEIIALDKKNSHGSSRLCRYGFLGFHRLPNHQRTLMREQLLRLATGDLSKKVRGMAQKYLDTEPQAAFSSSSSSATSSSTII